MKRQRGPENPKRFHTLISFNNNGGFKPGF